MGVVSEAHASFGSRGQRYHDLSGGNVGARPTRAGQRVAYRMVSHGFTPHAEEFGLEFEGINHGRSVSGWVLRRRRGLYAPRQ